MLRKTGGDGSERNVSVLQIGEVPLVGVGVAIAEPDLVEEKIDVGGCLREGDAGLEAAKDVERFIMLVGIAAPVGRDGGDHRHGNPDVRLLADGGAEKFRRGDTDDVEDGVSEFQLARKDVGVTGECAVPPSVADDGDGMVAFSAIIIVGEQTAHQRADAEGGEVRAGDELDLHRLRVSAAGNNAVDGVGHAEDGGGVGEDGVILLQFAVEGIGVEFGDAVRVSDATPGASAEQHELLRLLDGKIAEQDCVKKTEDGSVGANAESEREQSDGGERRTAKHRAQAVGDIFQKTFEPSPSPGEVALLAEKSGVAERAMGGAAGFIGRKAGCGMLLGAEFDVEAHLFVEVGVETAAVEEGPEAAEKFSGQVHDGS